MNKVEFIFELYRAGYSKEECCTIEDVIEGTVDYVFQPVQLIRKAAYQYLVACRDITKLRGFLLLVDEMNCKYPSSWDDATMFVLKVVCGWCT